MSFPTFNFTPEQLAILVASLGVLAGGSGNNVFPLMDGLQDGIFKAASHVYEDAVSKLMLQDIRIGDVKVQFHIPAQLSDMLPAPKLAGSE